MNKQKLLWPPWPDEVADSEARPAERRHVGCEGEQLALPITVDSNGVIEVLDEQNTAPSRSLRPRTQRSPSLGKRYREAASATRIGPGKRS
jgi:hypothetical protein